MDYPVVSILKATAAVCLGLGLSLLVFLPIVEVTDPNGYKITFVDPASGLPLYYPHSSVTLLTGCFENESEINNLGFHGPPVAPEKGSDVFRIIVIGSSIVEARQVQVGELFSTVLEQALNADPYKTHTYEVIPLGFNGNDTFLSTLYYKYYGSPLKPDLVIEIESGYELYRHLTSPPVDSEGAIILEAPKTVDSPPIAAARSVLRNSKLLVNLYSRALIFKEAAREFLQKPFFFIEVPSLQAQSAQEAERARWVLKEKLIGTLARLVEADSAQFLFAGYAGREEPETTIEEISRHLEDIAPRLGFSYANLVPYIQQQEETTGKPAAFLPCDGHWSQDGHRFVAGALLDYFSRHPQLLKRN